MTSSPKETATIAVLNTKLDGAINQISELKTQFDIFQTNFLRQDVYNIKHEDLVRQVTINSNEINHLQKNRWIMPTVSLVIGGVLAFLINFALSHGGNR